MAGKRFSARLKLLFSVERKIFDSECSYSVVGQHNFKKLINTFLLFKYQKQGFFDKNLDFLITALFFSKSVPFRTELLYQIGVSEYLSKKSKKNPTFLKSRKIGYQIVESLKINVYIRIFNSNFWSHFSSLSYFNRCQQNKYTSKLFPLEHIVLRSPY